MSFKDLSFYYKNQAILCPMPCFGQAIPVVYKRQDPELYELASQGIICLVGCLVSQKELRASHYCSKCKKYILN